MRRLLPAVLAILGIVVSGALVSHAGTTFSGGGGVASTRAINTTSPVAGGGDLSADRTLTFSNTYVDPSINGFRLSLTAGTAVTTADVTAATEVNLVSYTSNRIALWDGSEWDTLESDAVAPLALGTISDATNYDVYCYSNEGVITLDTPVAWTNDTTRATALVRQDGVWCQTGDLTRRYVGTFRTTATTTTEDSATNRFVFNAQNRVPRTLYLYDSTSHTYDTAAWRQWRNVATNQVAFVTGLAEEAITYGIVANIQHTSATSGSLFVGVQLNAATGADNDIGSVAVHAASRGLTGVFTARAYLSARYNFIAMTQYGAGATSTFMVGYCYGVVTQ